MKWFNRLTQMGLTLMLATVVAVPAARAEEANNNQDAPAQGQPAAGEPAQAQDQPAQAQDQPAQAQDQPAQEENGERQPRKLKIIELEHRDPQQLTQVLGLWDQVAPQGRIASGRVALQRVQTPQQPDAARTEKVAIAMDNEKKLLFVRGTEEQLEKIQSLVDAVDVDDEGLQAHDFGDYRLIPIPSAATGQVQSTLNQLDLAGQMIQLGNVSLVAYRVDTDEEDKLQQAEEVINKLAGRDKADSPDAPQDDAPQDDAAQDDAPQDDAAQDDAAQDEQANNASND